MNRHTRSTYLTKLHKDSETKSKHTRISLVQEDNMHEILVIKKKQEKQGNRQNFRQEQYMFSSSSNELHRRELFYITGVSFSN